jgi:hypothetical protein
MRPAGYVFETPNGHTLFPVEGKICSEGYILERFHYTSYQRNNMPKEIRMHKVAPQTKLQLPRVPQLTEIENNF